MKRYLVPLILVLFFLNGLFAADFKVNGVYTAWGQSQHNFWFENEKKPVYNDNYFVQMLRFKVQGIANENLKVVTRFDIAQGWWGVDNSLRSINRYVDTYMDTSGAMVKNKVKGGSALFDYKDTNFLFHVDQAYVDFKIPKTPLGFRVGRMWYGLGNKLILDNNYDGIQMDLNGVVGKKLTFSYAKVSEGVDGLSDEDSVAADARGFYDARDANLFTVNLSGGNDNLDYNVFALYYNDASVGDNNAYVPNHLQFFRARFTPQITTLMAFGVAGKYKTGKLSLNGEFDFLTGKDDIDNKDHGALQMVDINDGNIGGFNLYLKMNYAASDKLSLGLVSGMGSGDDDVTKGKGNVNKLRTSGFFYITEIWEDSIMPDEEGITPQGLGAPNVRGYRELENTTIVQLNGTAKPMPGISLFASYSYIMATKAIPKWDSSGNPDYSATANDLGQEVDFKFVWKAQKALAIGLRGGYFIPGTAAGYLINGTDKYTTAAWELKSFVTYKF